MKLTAELVIRARVHINAIREREIDLRAYKIPEIESLGATKDAFDSIDLSDNEISKLENFPLLKNLRMLLINNNRISRIADDLGNSMPNLDTLVLTGNIIASLSEIDALSSFTKLTVLSLLHNPVTRRQHYRYYVIHKIPSLKELDFKRISPSEREQAAKLFQTKSGQKLEAAVSKARTFTPGNVIGQDSSKPSTFTAQQLAAIESYLNKATSPDEIDRLDQFLKRGKLPPEIDPEQVKNQLETSTAATSTSADDVTMTH